MRKSMTSASPPATRAAASAAERSLSPGTKLPPEVQYPCWWTYAIVGPDEEDLRLAAGEVAKNTQHRVLFSKISAQKKFVSLHVEIHVASQDERDRYFEAFKTHPHIRYVI